MREFLDLLRRFDLRGIFLLPTQNGFLQFFRYAFVGGIAALADWGTLWLLTEALHLHYLVSAIIAFAVGLGVNYLLSKRFVFRADTARMHPAAEFFAYALIGVIGLGLTELILWLLGSVMHYMLAKLIAAAVVLLWNYGARKLLYRKKNVRK